MKHSFVCEQHFLSKREKYIYQKPNICNRLPSQKKTNQEKAAFNGYSKP